MTPSQNPALSNPPKIFCLGLHKTSTSSLANALYTLGYLVDGYFDTEPFADDEELTSYVVQRAGSSDAVQDMPWPEFYQLLDRSFPGSKFILTVRDEDRWLQSVTDHFADEVIDSHVRFYGVPVAVGYEDVYRERFRRHNQEVIDYFADRPGDLLVMDVAGGDGWEQLGEFLGVPTPAWDFPRQNAMSLHRATRYQRHAKAVVRYLARRTHLDQYLPGMGVVSALSAYPQVHAMCRQLDVTVAQLGDQKTDLVRGRLEGEVRSWLEDLLSWAMAVGAPGVPATVAQALGAWQLDTAWDELRPSVRQWAADLTDYGDGARAADGTAASGAVRELLQLGETYGSHIDSRFDDVESFAPLRLD